MAIGNSMVTVCLSLVHGKMQRFPIPEKKCKIPATGIAEIPVPDTAYSPSFKRVLIKCCNATDLSTPAKPV